MTEVSRWTELLASREKLDKARLGAKAIAERLYEQGLIRSAVFFGSIPRGDFSPGSDFDGLVISVKGKRKEVDRILGQSYSASKRRLGVEPSIIHISEREAKSGEHSLSPSIYSHMVGLGPNAFIGENPAKLVKFKQRKWVDNHLIQLEFYINELRKASYKLKYMKKTDADAYYSLLGRVVDRPLNAARTVLDITGQIPTVNGRKDDSKAAVLERYSTLFAKKPKAVNALKATVEAGRNYRRVLEQSLDAMKSGDAERIKQAKSDYAAALSQMEAAIPSAIKSFRHSARILEKHAHGGKLQKAKSARLRRQRRS